jgi:hypothetical protein
LIENFNVLELRTFVDTHRRFSYINPALHYEPGGKAVGCKIVALPALERFFNLRFTVSARFCRANRNKILVCHQMVKQHELHLAQASQHW